MGAPADIGPVMPPRRVVYERAREVAALAELARDCAMAGPRCNLARSLAMLDRIRAILGDPDGRV